VSGEPLIVGFGSPHGDDRAGWCVVEQLLAAGVSGRLVRIARTPADVWDWCDPHRELTLCDAIADGAPPGRVRRWTWPDDSFPARYAGTHDLPLSEVLDIGASLGCLPERVTICTISGAAFVPGSEPSPAVLEAALQLADELRGALCHA
jgi:hydrogenase maturation protease